MEQTPDFFKTAKEGWVDGIVVQNRELFIYYAVKMLHDYNTNHAEVGRSRLRPTAAVRSRRPSTPAFSSSPRTMSTRC